MIAPKKKDMLIYQDFNQQCVVKSDKKVFKILNIYFQVSLTIFILQLTESGDISEAVHLWENLELKEMSDFV